MQKIIGYDVTRFIQAQQKDYQFALDEIKKGKKESHWIWYIFPQLKGLGHSAMSEYYGIQDLGEAKAHLVEICSALLELDANDAVVVMGRPDDKKLKSSMTLFDAASGHQEIFEKVLEKYYQGKKDRRTLQLLDMKNR